ncbi:MAG: phage recombination protein Bet [Polyangiales bacterium]
MSTRSAERGLSRAEGSTPFEFTDEQRQIIRDSYANGASDEEFAVLMEIARARRLNPLLRQIHFVHRWDGEKGRQVWSAQVSIDGLRAIAERTGRYAGQDEPEFVENPDGTIKLCKVRVWRSDWPRPAVGIAYWNEYVQSIRDRQTGRQRPVALWGRMPRTMLAKCAEALALRRAFPEDVGGLYTPDEMGQAQNEAPHLAAVPTRGAQVVHARPVPTPRALPTTVEAPKEKAPDEAPAEKLKAERVAEAVIPTEVVQAERVPRVSKDPWLDFYG